MIRDPSDGSVREKPVAGIPTSEMPVPKPGLVSGLPSVKPSEAERLEEVREWLKEWHGYGSEK